MKRVKWNIERARQRWVNRDPRKEIAADEGISLSCLLRAANRERWPRGAHNLTAPRERIDPVMKNEPVPHRCYDCGGKFLAPPGAPPVCGCNRVPAPLSGVAA